LSALAREHGLPEGAAAQLASILALVATEPSSITTIRDPAAAVDAHVADSLVALRLPVVRAARRIADLGAGAGFPGLALAAALPEARVTLVESVGKKCRFMETAAQAASLANVEVLHTRAEDWSEGRESCDLVTARALAPLNVVCEYAAPLLATAGTLVAWKGRRAANEERDAAAAAAQLGLELTEIVPVSPWSGSGERHLYLYSKVSSTPSRFPRRAGMARKHPLTASG
jgi:16S rRNA (guanine527-N7)-methyltransferase